MGCCDSTRWLCAKLYHTYWKRQCPVWFPRFLQSSCLIKEENAANTVGRCASSAALTTAFSKLVHIAFWWQVAWSLQSQRMAFTKFSSRLVLEHVTRPQVLIGTSEGIYLDKTLGAMIERLVSTTEQQTIVSLFAAVAVLIASCCYMYNNIKSDPENINTGHFELQYSKKLRRANV